MKYFNVKRIADIWEISERRVVTLLRAGRIPGAIKNGLSWQIPANAIKPYDKRSRYSASAQTKKRVIIAGINNQIGRAAARLLADDGFDIIGLHQPNIAIDKNDFPINTQFFPINYGDKKSIESLASLGGYFDGFIFAELFLPSDLAGAFRLNIESTAAALRTVAPNMNYGSGIVVLNVAVMPSSILAARHDLIKTLSDEFSLNHGLRINSITAPFSVSENYMGMPDVIANDLTTMVTRHAFTTGETITSRGMYLRFEDDISDVLTTREFYIWLHKIISELKRGDIMHTVEIVHGKEWADNALERQFLLDNLDAAQRGVKMRRIIISGKSKLKNLRKNQFINTLISHSKIEISWINPDTLEKKLIDEIKYGFAVYGDFLFRNIAPTSDGDLQGQIIRDKKQIERALRTFANLRKLSTPLK